MYTLEDVRAEVLDYIDSKVGDLYCGCYPVDRLLLDKAPKIYDGERFYSAFC